jgi:prephenate dehydrogenase
MSGPSQESGRSASGKPEDDLLEYVERLRQQAEEFQRALEEEARELIKELRGRQAKRPRL